MGERPGWLDDSLAEEWVEPDEVDMSLDHEGDAEEAHQLSGSVLVSPVATPSRDMGDQLRHQHLAVNEGNRHASGSGSSVTAVPSSPSLPPPPSPPPLEGTFLIREDVEHQPITPAVKAAGFPFRKGRGKQFEAFTKSIFSPLALEKMFDPPSPPEARTPAHAWTTGGAFDNNLQPPLIPLPLSSSASRAYGNARRSPQRRSVVLSHNLDDREEDDVNRSDEILASDIPNLLGFNGRVPSARFTFHVSHGPTTSTPRQPAALNRSNPNAHRASGPRPRVGLKLFQTYDTYTKDHLSALVESIDVKSSPPSASERDDCASPSCGRSTKRIRLSAPESDRKSAGTIKSRRGPTPSNLSPQHPPLINRPGSRAAPRDYLGESRSLMEQIKNNRSFSLSTTMSKRDNKGLSFVDEGEDEDFSHTPLRSAKVSTVAGSYKQQAASLMAQIKSDVEGKENEDPRYNSNSSQSGTGSWSDVSSIRESLGKVHLDPKQSRQDGPAIGRARSASPPTIIIEPNSPTEPLPELPRPLIDEPERESSISLRKINPEDEADQGQQPQISSQVSLPVPGPTEAGPSRLPSLSTAPSSSRFTVASGQRSGSGTSTTTTSSIGSTTTATTNNSQASVGSNVKRAGSPGRPRIRTIAPDEVGPITRVGDMRWDPVRMLWTKDRTKSQTLNSSRKRDRTFVDDASDGDIGQGEDISEDVFRDIESLRDGPGNATITGSLNFGKSAACSRTSSSGSAPRTTILRERRPFSPPARNEDDDPREGGVTGRDSEDEHNKYCQDLLDRSTHVPREDSEDDISNPLAGSDDDIEFDSGAADPDAGRTPSLIHEEDLDKISGASYASGETSSADLQRNFESTFSEEEESYQQVRVVGEGPPTTSPLSEGPGTPHNGSIATPRPILIPSQSTPHPFPHANARPRPPIPPVPARSALKQTPSPSGGGGPFTPATVGKYTRMHRRSVSFSDGRKDGKIQNVSVGRPANESDEDGGHDQPMRDPNDGYQVGIESRLSITQSFRAGRIEGMLAALEEASVEDTTPSRTSLPQHHLDTSTLIPFSARASTFSRSSGGASYSHSAVPSHLVSSSEFETTSTSRSASTRRPTRASARNWQDMSVAGNQTILTQASFAVTQDRLVQVITQVHPYEPHWEKLSEIDLSGFGLESVTKMKEHLPALVKLDLHDNQLSYLTGVPAHLRGLRVSNNQLTSLTSYSHLQSLEHLDISNNQVDSLTQLVSLERLQDLRADGNRITDIAGLEGMTCLIRLSLKRNRIVRINVNECSWPHLELLDLSANSLTSVKGLSTLHCLSLLNLDHNKLTSLMTSKPLPRLRMLRASNNRLAEFHASPFVHLRTLYLDSNRLREIYELDKLPKLDNLSLRNQVGGHMQLSSRDTRDVKRLYLSGNPLVDLAFLSTPCYNLIYLELAGCRISNLPSNLAAMVPNIRVLNLNYNFIADAGPLNGLVRLKRLTLVGSRLRSTKTFLKALRDMPDIEMVDIRMNPSTLGWYLPLLVRDIPGALQPSESRGAFPPVILPISEEEVDCTRHSAVRLHPFADRADQRVEADSKATQSKRTENATWEDLDSKFRRDLPNDSYLGRLSYRGLVMRACPGVQIIDGVRVTEGEKEKAEQYLKGILRARQAAGS